MFSTCSSCVNSECGYSGMLCNVNTCPLAAGNCETSVQCIAKVKLEEALHKYFSFPVFRDGQLDALLPVVHGRDVFVRMATGAGKSLCMFLAPLAISESAVGVVISPLNGLMEQQVCNLLYCVSQLLAMTKI